MKAAKVKKIKRIRRHARARAKISGNAVRPRLSVFRSASHIYAQLIDDATDRTLAAFSTAKLSKLKADKKQKAEKVGEELGKIALAKGIKQAAFDRGGYAYHGRVRALAEGARKAGLDF
jgi:large subunit ribosomal protein L18